MRRSRPLARTAPVVLVAVTLVACSGGSGEDAAAPTAPSTERATPSAPSAPSTPSASPATSSASAAATTGASAGVTTPPGPVGMLVTTSGGRIYGQGRALFAVRDPGSDRTIIATTFAVAVATGDEPPTTLAGASATQLALAPDGSRVAAIMADGSLSTWDMATLEPVDDVPLGAATDALSLHFAGPDALVVGDANAVTVEHVDATPGDRTFETLVEAGGAGGPLGPVGVGVGGRVTVPAAAPTPVVVTWAPGGTRQTFDPGLGAGGRISAVLASSDGAHVAVVGATATGGDELRIWDVAAGAVVGTPVALANFVTPRQLAFPTPDRVVIPLVGRVAAFDLTGAEVASMPLGESSVSTIQAAGDAVLVTTADGTARRWTPGTEPSSLGDPTGPLVHADATTGIGTVDQQGLVRTYDADGRSHRELTEFAVGEYTGIAPVDDASFAISSSTGVVRVIDAATGTTTASFDRRQGAVTSVAVSPDTATLATAVAVQERSEAWDDTIEATDRAGGATMFELGGQAEDVAGCAFYEGLVRFSPDGTLLASSSHDFTVQVTPLADPDATTVLPPHLGTVYDLQFSPDGTTLVTSADDGSLRAWTVDGWQLVGEHRGGVGAYTSLAFAPDGTLLASTAAGEISVVDVTTGAPTRTFAGRRTVLGSMVVSPDGTQLYAPLDGGAVGVWDVASGALVDELTGHTREVSAIALSPDGTRVLTASRDGTVRTWPLRA